MNAVSFSALAALAGAVLLLSFGAIDAHAKTTSVNLRVEGRSGTLEPGRGYVAGTVRAQRATGVDCRRTQGRPRFPGATPIGAVGLAAHHNRRLRPQRMRVTDFGWLLCGVGSDIAFGTAAGDFGGWLYRVNHEPGTAAVDQARLRAGDEVLLHFAVFPAQGSATDPVQNGRELVLRGAPTRARPGEAFTVRVVAFDFDPDSPMPGRGSDGIVIEGAGAPVAPDESGRAEITLDEPGTARLRAVHAGTRDGEFGPEHDIPSARVAVCVRANPSRCPRARGTLIRGSKRADRIRATRGDDVIRAGRGNDVVNLRPGGRNRVFCGKGRDTVIVNKGKRRRNVLRGCQRVVAR
jgi:hypothetical protein